MRPLSYRADELRSLLLRNRMAALDELKHALGASVDVTLAGVDQEAVSGFFPYLSSSTTANGTASARWYSNHCATR